MFLSEIVLTISLHFGLYTPVLDKFHITCMVLSTNRIRKFDLILVHPAFFVRQSETVYSSCVHGIFVAVSISKLYQSPSAVRNCPPSIRSK